MIKKFIFLTLVMALSRMAWSQKGPTQVNTRNIQTILLDLDDSTGGIVIQDQVSGEITVPKRSFEINSKRPVVFKIININPLRHNYFLNDELVTNFFDGNSAVVANNTYITGVNPVKEIPAINIFNFEANVVTDADEQLAIRDMRLASDRIRTEYQVISDTLEKINNEILSLPGYEDQLQGKKISSEQDNAIKTKLQKYNDAYFKSQRIGKNLSDKLTELLTVLNNLSNKDISILETRLKYKSLFSDKDFIFTLNKVDSNFTDMKTDLVKLDSIINLVQHIKPGQLASTKERYSGYYTKSQTPAPTIDNPELEKRKRLWKLLEYFNYLDGNAQDIISDMSPSNGASIAWTEERFRIMEYILNQKNKRLESCILFNSLEVGKLLEMKWIESARHKNIYLNKSSITVADIDSAARLRESTTEFFNYVKGWIADFALLNQSVKLDNKVFKSVHQNITDNCAKFLDFIRDLDHLALPNITEYTSPIYHNQKNVDMIRFKVDKQDKLTTSKQTYEYDMWIKGGIKIDFSVGLFASGLVDKQYNKMPYYIKDSTVVSADSLFISQSDPGNYNFCFGGMVNISRRNGAGWLNVGGSVGIAYSANQKLQGLAGLNIHLGKTERLILHAGLAFGTIKVMDSEKVSILDGTNMNVPEGSVFAKGNYAEFTVPDIERFTVKPFLGISYNLSKQNSLQAVKSQGGLQYYNSQLP